MGFWNGFYSARPYLKSNIFMLQKTNLEGASRNADSQLRSSEILAVARNLDERSELYYNHELWKNRYNVLQGMRSTQGMIRLELSI